MTIQNPLVALIPLITLLLSVNGQTNKSEVSKTVDTEKSIEQLEEVAGDAISLSVAEINRTKDFINSVPQLKSLGNSNKSLLRVEPDHCVEGIVDGMNDVVRKLEQLKKLDSPFLKRSSKSLQISVRGVLGFKGLCRRALADPDTTIKLMLRRKLEDIMLLTRDVIFRVRKFDLYAKG